MPMSREDKRKAFTGDDGTMHLKRLIPMPGAAAELAVVEEGANGRTFLVAKTAEALADPPTDTNEDGADSATNDPAETAAETAEGAETKDASKGGVSTEESRIPTDPVNPVGSGDALTVPEAIEPADVPPKVSSRFKSWWAGLWERVTGSAKADPTTFGDAMLASQVWESYYDAEYTLWQVIGNILASDDLTDKESALASAFDAFRDHMVGVLAGAEKVDKAAWTTVMSAVSVVRKESPAKVRDAIKAALDASEPDSEDEMNENEIRELVQTELKSALPDAIAEAQKPLVDAVGKVSEAVVAVAKMAGLPDGALAKQLGGFPGTPGGTAGTVGGSTSNMGSLTRGKSDGEGEESPLVRMAAKIDALEETAKVQAKTVETLLGAVIGSNQIVQTGAKSHADDELGIAALGDFTRVSREVNGQQ